ncbi:MAG TPA: ribose-phosphate diphosphokinase, partial [Planctomycetaceae bacterium]|nr:ribose-phosphate diphosphokinase [Planctomycetaceae bacterium]
MYDHLTLLSGRAHPQLAGEIAEYLGIRLASVELSNL